MTALNLPEYNVRTCSKDGKTMIFDILRNKYVALTPEEWVRQHFVNYLINYKGYPKSLMNNEVKIIQNGITRRCDTILYGQDLNPRLIIEYKSTDIKITQKVFDQITRYNMVLNVDFLIVSNGIEHYCCRINYAKKSYSFLQDIPEYKSLI